MYTTCLPRTAELWVLQALSSDRDSVLSPTHPKSLKRAVFQLQFKCMRHSRPITALYHNSTREEDEKSIIGKNKT